jgi:transposase InsO family protein
MPWQASSVMDERIKFVVGASQEAVNFSALCRAFGISRPTGYKWLRRFKEASSLSGLREHSRRPREIPHRTPRAHEERAIILRLRYGWGGKKLRELLLQEGLDLKVTTINRILKRNGLINPTDSHSPAVKRFERQHPNELWQMDFKGDYRLNERRCYPLSIIDDHSRFGLGLFALPGQDGPAVYSCLLRTFESYGVPEAMLMDHGTPWWSTTNNHGLTWLSVSLIKQGIRLYLSGVGHPQTQGKVERFHRTLAQAVRHHGRPMTLSGWKKLFNCFLDEYNHIRPHEALDMATPAERYQPSRKAYNPHPPEWEYPPGAIIKRLNTQGCLDYNHRRFFVCEALAEQRVRIEQVENRLIVSFRKMYIREINIKTGRSTSLLTPRT